MDTDFYVVLQNVLLRCHCVRVDSVVPEGIGAAVDGQDVVVVADEGLQAAAAEGPCWLSGAVEQPAGCYQVLEL